MDSEEAQIYAELVKAPATHLQLSRQTNINRTKIYRLVSQLEKRGLVMRKSDDQGTFLIAGDPTMLEIEIAARENKIQKQKNAINQLKPMIDMMRGQDQSAFAVYTYEGNEGMKQMQWHELKAKDEVLVLGNVTVEQLVSSRSWAERYRMHVAQAGYQTREIINSPYKNPKFTDCEEFWSTFKGRTISKKILPISTPVIIYNHTVATYQLSEREKFGIEIVSKAYVETMRHVFEHYWNLAKE